MPDTIIIKDLNQLTQNAHAIARLVINGDVITLQGDLGVGKTEWARAFIRFFLGADQPVPSPTFSLVQTYHTSILPVWHFDLYRIDYHHDVWELGLEEALAEGVSIIEWPEKLQGIHLNQQLAIKIDVDKATQDRVMTFDPDATWRMRLAKII